MRSLSLAGLANADPASADDELLRPYPVAADVYDEMWSAPGVLRPHWEYLARSLAALGSDELRQRATEVARLLREDGVTYNVYNDRDKQERVWDLDPIPTLLTSREWSGIEAGLIQRAELLDLLLGDLYGSRSVIRKGVLPPELILGSPGYFHACAGMRFLGKRPLCVYAADVMRDPKGAVWVIGDRAQAPSGSGYALENRVVLSRVLPSLFRDSQVHRLALFFRTLRSTLHSLAPNYRQGDPRIVLLTPGPGNETYFEHAYLAKYLGFTLVQGSDLSVRDRRVWLKTLDGLQPVDVILRRLDDDFCDPLELRKDSLLGTPGLVEAARSGRVAIANPLGSGILENPGLMAYLPKLAKHLLGEDLRLPSTPTWWCGDPVQREHVLANLSSLAIKPIHHRISREIVLGDQLSAAERSLLADRIRRRPHAYVGQERMALSTTPVLRDGLLEPRPMVLRAFLVVVQESYMVMPGGLTRVAANVNGAIVSNQQGGVSKDTWVLASEPERQVSLLMPASRPLMLTREGGEVPSRIADNLFWLGRYTERTEGIARLLREAVVRVLDTETQRESAVPDLLRCLTDVTGSVPGFVGAGAEKRLAEPEGELLTLLFDPDRMGSLRYNLNALIRASRSVRDRLSEDSRRIINNLDADLKEVPRLSDVIDPLERVIFGLAALAGMFVESMTRGQGWRFLDIGRRIERGLHTLRLLRSFGIRSGMVADALLEVLLEITDSLMTYRRRYRSRVQASAVLDLLFNDESNPRSIAFQLVRLQEQVAGLPRVVAPPHRNPEERLVLHALSTLRLAEIDSLLQLPNAAEGHRSLHKLFESLRSHLSELSDTLDRNYFSPTEKPQPLADIQ